MTSSRLRALAISCLLILCAATAVSIYTKEDLKEFFKTTFLRKETGAYTKEGKKTVYATGYNPSWSFYRFHHVCIRGGNDGIFVGIDGVKSIAPESETTISPGEWNDLIGSRFNDPLTAFILEDNPNVNLSPVFFRNSTIFTNCNRQHSLAYNPSLFMMKIGFLYELATCMVKNLGRHRIFKNDINMPFSQVFLHQCPNPESSKWNWGKSVWHIVEKKLNEAMLLKDNRTNIIRRGSESTGDELLCFDDLYLSTRVNHWIQGPENLINFREEAAVVTGEPVQAKTISEEPSELEPKGANKRVYQSYCNREAAAVKPTNARIKIFQRTLTEALRAFVNLDEVVAMVQQYTTVPVEVVSTTENNTIQEQIRLFNSFDILITPHGSHLANGIFSMHPYTKAVVEVAPYMIDSNYFNNYNGDLGFAEYIMSTGHLTPHASVQGSGVKTFCAFQSYSDFGLRGCSLKRKDNVPHISQDWITCAAGFHSRGCDISVNTTILKHHMDKMFNESLCSPGAIIPGPSGTTSNQDFSEVSTTTTPAAPVAIVAQAPATPVVTTVAPPPPKALSSVVTPAVTWTETIPPAATLATKAHPSTGLRLR